MAPEITELAKPIPTSEQLRMYRALKDEVARDDVKNRNPELYAKISWAVVQFEVRYDTKNY